MRDKGQPMPEMVSWKIITIDYYSTITILKDCKTLAAFQ